MYLENRSSVTPSKMFFTTGNSKIKIKKKKNDFNDW